MYTAVMFVNNSKVSQKCNTISEAINYLSSQMDLGKGHLGEVQSEEATLATVRRDKGVTKIKPYSSVVLSNLNLKLSTPIEIEGNIIQKGGSFQSIGTNIKVDGDISFGNLTQES